MAAAVAACVGRVPTVCGKPEPLAMELICAENQIDRNRTCMVGDTLYTDMAFANRSGVRSVLVLSGNTGLAAGEAAQGDERPQLILDSVADLFITENHDL